jgi:hypothetical protein
MMERRATHASLFFFVRRRVCVCVCVSFLCIASQHGSPGAFGRDNNKKTSDDETRYGARLHRKARKKAGKELRRPPPLLLLLRRRTANDLENEKSRE